MEKSHAMRLNEFLENNCKQPFDFWAYIFTVQYQLKRKGHVVISLEQQETKSGKKEVLFLKSNFKG